MIHEPMLLTLTQFCGRVGISKAHASREIAAGRIQCVRLGERSLRIPMTEVEGWVSRLPMNQHSDQEG